MVSPRLIQMGAEGESACSPLDKKTIQATRCAMEVTGVGIHDVELLQIKDDFDVSVYEEGIAVSAELGAERLTASTWSDRDNNRNHIVDSFAALCEMAAGYGLSVSMEFPTFSRLKNLNETVDIVKAADCENGGILIDTLYTHLSRVDPSELEGLPPKWFSYIQICDIPPGVPDDEAAMIYLARNFRLYPGEGAIDFAAIVKRLPPVHFSIELPNRNRITELGYEEHARRCLQATKNMLASLHSNPDSRHSRNGPGESASR